MEAPRSFGWPMVGGVAALAAVAGYGIAQFLTPEPAPSHDDQTAAAAGPAEVKIPEQYIQSSNIVVEPVSAGAVGADILAPATISATPQGEAVIVARASGTVSRINRRLGDAVRAGEAIAFVDSIEAAGFSADRSVAATKVALARQTYEREASLFRQGVSPRADMEAARAALAVAEAEASRAGSVARAAHVAGNGRSVAVVSPISGKVTAESVTLGAYVEPQTELFRVASSEAVQVEAAVTGDEARRVRPGDRASIVAANGAPVEATVRSVTPTVSGSSQTATVVIVPAAGTPQLVVGEGVQVRIHASSGSGQSGVTVPEDAVQVLEGRDVLFVRTKDGFTARPVLVGARSGGSAQILSGVKVGEQIATRNAFLVKAEIKKGADEE